VAPRLASSVDVAVVISILSSFTTSATEYSCRIAELRLLRIALSVYLEFERADLLFEMT
jgi:hypothetical protein